MHYFSLKGASILPTHVKLYTFAQLRSMKNVQTLMYSSGTNKYIWKYIEKMDDSNNTIVGTGAHKKDTLVTGTQYKSRCIQL